jgi:hypothetical protein
MLFPWQEDIKKRIETLAGSFGMSLARQFGFGYDGMVFKTDAGTAIKGFKHKELCCNERDVYLRLHELDLFEVCGASIPHIFSNDDNLWCIEMEIVAPPFVLDFAGAYLDARPEFPEDVMAAWTAEKQEQYGEDWAWVQDIMRELAGVGVHLADVKPGNITLR